MGSKGNFQSHRSDTLTRFMLRVEAEKNRPGADGALSGRRLAAPARFWGWVGGVGGWCGPSDQHRNKTGKVSPLESIRVESFPGTGSGGGGWGWGLGRVKAFFTVRGAAAPLDPCDNFDRVLPLSKQNRYIIYPHGTPAPPNELTYILLITYSDSQRIKNGCGVSFGASSQLLKCSLFGCVLL